MRASLHCISNCMSPVPRAALVPLTSKQPLACPHCGSRNITRRGTRKKKLEIVQLWRCASCKHVFTPGPAALRNKTYPLRMILAALTDYNLGYSLEETARAAQKKTRPRRLALDDHRVARRVQGTHAATGGCAAEGLRRFPAEQTIRSIKLYHRQIYGYAYHRPKLELVRDGALDDKRSRRHARFAAVADFLERIPTDLPA